MPVIIFFKDIFEKRDVIYGLSKQDFKTRFAGSVLGLLWAFIQPLAMMLILWFVFSVGLKMGLTRNIPFPAWFFTAMILWNFVSDRMKSIIEEESQVIDVLEEDELAVKKKMLRTIRNIKKVRSDS